MAQVRVTNRVTFDLGWRLRAEGSVPRSAVRSDVGVRALVEHGVIRWLGISVTNLDHGSELATDAGGVSACDPYWAALLVSTTASRVLEWEARLAVG